MSLSQSRATPSSCGSTQLLLEEPGGRSRDWSQACSTWPQQVRLSRGYIDRRRSTRVCGRSCVRGFCLLPCCGAKLVPLPLSRAGTLGCGRGGAAQGRRRAGTVVRGRSPSDGGGGGGRARRAHHPPPNGRRRAHGRAEFPRPLFAALPPVGARGRVRGRLVRVPRPTAARGESEPRPPPGLQSDLGAWGLARRSRRPFPPAASLPRARRAFPPLARGSSLARTRGGFYFGAGRHESAMRVFRLGKQKCSASASQGVKGGAANAWIVRGDNNPCVF